ncbi:hypothetical protein HanPSC8_Chr09g0371121 [Helianthus annuus]|nr:hypothetical protein HanPSC8_Chr09g0371121 [Helianthus annuus]
MIFLCSNQLTFFSNCENPLAEKSRDPTNTILTTSGVGQNATCVGRVDFKKVKSTKAKNPWNLRPPMEELRRLPLHHPLEVNVRMNISVIALVIHVVITLYGRPFLNFRYPPGN